MPLGVIEADGKGGGFGVLPALIVPADAGDPAPACSAGVPGEDGDRGSPSSILSRRDNRLDQQVLVAMMQNCGIQCSRSAGLPLEKSRRGQGAQKRPGS